MENKACGDADYLLESGEAAAAVRFGQGRQRPRQIVDSCGSAEAWSIHKAFSSGPSIFSLEMSPFGRYLPTSGG